MDLHQSGVATGLLARFYRRRSVFEHLYNIYGVSISETDGRLVASNE